MSAQSTKSQEVVQNLPVDQLASSTASQLDDTGEEGGASSASQTKLETPEPAKDPAPAVNTPQVQENSSPVAPQDEPVSQPNIQVVPAQPQNTVPAQPVAPNGTYTNVDGNTVPSPYAAPSIPAGATARCFDGTYSFSQNHRGTCSHHGGVAEWF